jgi:hypothetical protein
MHESLRQYIIFSLDRENNFSYLSQIDQSDSPIKLASKFCVKIEVRCLPPGGSLAAKQPFGLYGSPDLPDAHSQAKPPIWLTHRVPGPHGLDLHSLMSAHYEVRKNGNIRISKDKFYAQRNKTYDTFLFSLCLYCNAFVY